MAIWNLLSYCHNGLLKALAVAVLFGMPTYFGYTIVWVTSFNTMMYVFSVVVWWVHWILYIGALFIWVRDPAKVSIAVATGMGVMAAFMLRYYTWLCCFWMFVLTYYTKLWHPLHCVETASYWIRAFVLFCCVVQILVNVWDYVTDNNYVTVVQQTFTIIRKHW